MVYEKRSVREDANLQENLTGPRMCPSSGPRMRIIGTMALVLCLGSSAFAEIMVQPMILRRQVQPGKRVAMEFNFENVSRDTADAVTFKIADLTQDANGVWEEVKADGSNVNGSMARSCKSWITSTVDSVQLDPWQRAPVTLVVNVPSGTRGFYFAALIAETLPVEEQPDGVTALFTVQYLVPIILECQNIPPRRDISLTDVNLTYQAPTVEKAAGVTATLDITNKGGSYSRLLGQVRVWQRSPRGNWHKVADLTLPETGIIPDVTLHLKQNIGTLLPDGQYKLEGYLFVDGKRANAISKEINFKGDSRTTTVKAASPIDVEKTDLFIEVTPGASRTSSVTIGNGSEERLNVETEVVVPPSMTLARSAAGVKGDDLSCADWVIVTPASFSLDRYGRRTLSITVRAPNSASYSHYYATLLLHATYADGSPGGTRETRICVNNAKGTDKPMVKDKSFTISEASPSRYFATVTFANEGVTHVKPKCRGLLTEAGSTGGVWKRILMSSEAFNQTGIFLPFETRAFQGVLDVSSVPAGTYRLTAVLEVPGLPGGEVQSQQLIEVYEQGTLKKVKIVPFENAPDGKGRMTIQL